MFRYSLLTVCLLYVFAWNDMQLIAGESLVLLKQPLDQTVCRGEQVVLAVRVQNGAQLDLEYQWFHNDEALTDGNRNPLVLEGVNPLQAGDYSCRVRCGTSEVNSRTAKVVVLDATWARIDAPSVVRPGDSIFLEAITNAHGADATFRWFENGQALSDIPDVIEGSSSNRLYLYNIAFSDTPPTYTCIVTGQCGSAVTEGFTLDYDNPTISIVRNPEGQSGCENDEFCFSVEAATSTPGTLAYEWRYSDDDSPIAGANTASFCMKALASDKGRSVYCRVFLFDAPGVATNSEPAALDITAFPTIILQPENDTVCAGTPVTFRSEAVEDGSLIINWQLSTDSGVNWNDIERATRATLSLAPVSTSQDQYWYRAAFTNKCGTFISAQAVLVVKARAEISRQPAHPKDGRAMDFNEYFRLDIEGTRNEQCSVQWRRDGADIPDATGMEYSAFMRPQHEGVYTAVMRCPCDTVTSDAVTLSMGTTDVEPQYAAAGRLVVKGISPTPLHDSGVLSLRLGRSSEILLSVFDLVGNRMTTRMLGRHPAGEQRIALKGLRQVLAPGTYVYRVRAGAQQGGGVLYISP